MKPLHIACDLDGICVDMLSVWLELYNAEMAEDDEEWEVAQITGPVHHCVRRGNEIYDIMNRPGFFEHLPELDGAVESLAYLKELGHDITIVTSPGKSLYAPTDKTKWCRRHMPFLEPDDVAIMKKKHKVKADVFVDDSPSKIDAYRLAWPDAYTMGIAWPYNDQGHFHLRAESYLEPEKAWAEMVQKIERLSAL